MCAMAAEAEAAAAMEGGGSDCDPVSMDLEAWLALVSDNRPRLIDVRDEAAFAARRLEGSANLWVEDLTDVLFELPEPSTPLALVAHNIGQGEAARALLRAKGWRHLPFLFVADEELWQAAKGAALLGEFRRIKALSNITYIFESLIGTQTNITRTARRNSQWPCPASCPCRCLHTAAVSCAGDPGHRSWPSGGGHRLECTKGPAAALDLLRRWLRQRAGRGVAGEARLLDGAGCGPPAQVPGQGATAQRAARGGAPRGMRGGGHQERHRRVINSL